MFDIKNKSNAYVEVLEVLKRLNEKDYNRVPKDIIEKFESEANNEYSFEYDDNKDLKEQNLMEETKVYLAVLFKKYWATDEQKQKISSYQIKKINEDEIIKKENYNPNDIFKNQNINSTKKEKNTDKEKSDNINNEMNVEHLEIMEIPKMNIFDRIVNFIKEKFGFLNK